jgi:hypothetical protein
VTLTGSVPAFLVLKFQVEWNHQSRDRDRNNNKDNEGDGTDFGSAFPAFLSGER